LLFCIRLKRKYKIKHCGSSHALCSVSDDKSIEALSVGVLVTDEAIGVIPGSPSLDLQ
jgi:hypothetical protein